ncbi:MAG: hypothetical protein JST26_07270 [Bacteroidetes bacterium]|nr:hypothetical protein [Bacteroidota bacterium]
MNFTIELTNMRDHEAVYTEKKEDGTRNIVFDFEIVKNNLLSKKSIYLFPESFSNWSSGSQESIPVFEYIVIIKRVIRFFNDTFPESNVFFGVTR